MKSFLTLVVFCLLACICLCEPLPASTLYVAIRVDDVLSRNTSVAWRSIVPFQDTVEAHGGKVTWAVIPGRLTEETNKSGAMTRELKATLLRGHEVSMHGLTHVCPRCGGTSHEMYCTTYNTHFSAAAQQKLIDDGLKILHDSLGMAPLMFVPPGHAADSTTFAVCRDRGFIYASTTLKTRTKIDGGLFNVAPHAEFTWQLSASDYEKNMHAALADIRGIGRRDGYYCLLLHDYFTRLGYSNGLVLRWIGEVIDSVKREYKNDVRFVTVSEAARIFSQTTQVASASHPAVPETGRLLPNYPNPFNPSTMIAFALPEESRIRLSICDALGRTLDVLAEGVWKAGMHGIGWNAPAWLSSGVYFSSLEVTPLYGASSPGIFRQMRPLLLLK
ncbi:MAG: DUF2334 domain-containing protein [Acidobacteriota bacterium]